MTISNKNTNGVRTIPLGEREVMQELTSADPNYGKIRVGTDGTYVGEVLLAKDIDVVANTNAISELDTRLDTAESDIDTLQSDVVGLDGRLGTAESTLSTAVGNIAALDGRLGIVEDTVADSNLARADKYLASQNVVNMEYNAEGKLAKVQYNNPIDDDYEVLSYNAEGKLSNVAHYVATVLKGNTVLSYSNGKLVSAPYTAI